MTQLLELRDVDVHFGGVRAVDQLSLAIEQGRTYGLVGPNGSGKSTLLGAVSRLTPTTGGALFFRGTEYTHRPPQVMAREGIGRTFQTVRLIPTLSVLQNVALGADAAVAGTGIWRPWLLPRWLRRVERRVLDTAEQALERLGIQDFRHRLPTELSYGAQRKVEIARSIAARPTLLLLDEPTAGMTNAERAEIVEVIATLRAEGMTQLLVDHDVDMIVTAADHLFVMNTGRLIASGAPAEVVQLPVVHEAYLGKRHRGRS